MTKVSMRYLHNFMDEPQNDYEESLKQAEAAAIGLKGKGLPVEVSGVDGEPDSGTETAED